MASAVRRTASGRSSPSAEQRAGRALEGIVGGQRDERPRALAALGQPVVGDVLVHGERIGGGLPLGRRLMPPRARGASRLSSGSSQIWCAARIRWT